MSTDLLAMQTTGLGGQGPVTLNLFDAPAEVSGVQVMAQRFLTLFLRDYDERTDLGTSFIKEVTSSRIVNDPILLNLVGQAVLRVQEQFPDVGDPDELLRTAKILAARKVGDGILVRFELTSQGGTSVTFELPRII